MKANYNAFFKRKKCYKDGKFLKTLIKFLFVLKSFHIYLSTKSTFEETFFLYCVECNTKKCSFVIFEAVFIYSLE